MLKWSEDDDFWVRRIAIDHQLCRKLDTDIALLENEPLSTFSMDSNLQLFPNSLRFSALYV